MATYMNLLLFIVQLCYVSAGPRTKLRHTPDDAIIFPEQLPLFNKHGSEDEISGSPLVPPECQHKTYCTIKPKNYPEEMFNKIFKNKKIPPPPTLVADHIADRWEEDENSCKVDVSYEPIYIVKKRSGEWRNVAQAPKHNYEQKIRMETCVEQDAPCFKVFPSIPDYTPFCKQKFNTWEILVSIPEGGTEVIKTELPVCCSCFYRPVDLKNA